LKISNGEKAMSNENPNNDHLEGRRCPQCGSYGPFTVSTQQYITLTDEGAEDPPKECGDIEFDANSPTMCQECDYAGNWGDFEERCNPEDEPELVADIGALEDVSGAVEVTFDRSAVEDYLDRPLTTEEWERLRATNLWTACIKNRLYERGWDLISEALHAAGINEYEEDE
jgi:hypothetical protein